MPHRNAPEPGLPSRQQVLDFIASSPDDAGKRELARAFGLKGQEKIKLKALLKDMADEGLVDGTKRAFHRMGGIPRVTVLRVVAIEDGEAIAVPDNWEAEGGMAPPKVRLVERGPKVGRGISATKIGDRVLARTEESGNGWRAHPMKKLAVRSVQVLGVIEFDASGQAWLAPVDKRIRTASKVADVGEAVAGNLVLAEPIGRSERAGVKVTQVLGDPLAPRAFSLIAIHKHGIPFAFTPEAVAEAQAVAKLPVLPTENPGAREDLTHLPIVAIDPADARDHDDAIWAEPDPDPANPGGYRAVVAIADVSYYVRPGGKLDREARVRGNSVYFPDRVVPMLPDVLSAQVCSLKAGIPRAAMACHMTIDAKGRLRDWRFTRARVQIVEVIAYEEAQRRIDAGPNVEGGAAPYLNDLWAAWKLLDAARAAREPLALELPERRVTLDEMGRITEVGLRERLDAHRVVEEFMIAANVAAAKALEAKVAPVVYRIHEPPSREKLVALKDYMATFGRSLALGQVVTPSLFNRLLKDIADDAERTLVMEAVLRSQTQAYYGPRNAGHFGLSLGSYAHFTSPIRRYSDLLVHRALVDAYQLEQPRPDDRSIPATSGLSEQDRADLGKVADAISQTERRAMEAERDTMDRYVAAWLSVRVGEVFDTRVTGVQKFGLFATIVGLGGDGLVPISTLGEEYFTHDEKAQALVGEKTGTRFERGQLLKLRLAEANPLTGALKFEPVDAEPGAGRVERRGDRPAPKFARQNKRGRPANIKHQGRKR